MKFGFSIIVPVLLVVSSLVGAIPIGPQEIEREAAEGLSLLRLGADADPVWKTEEEKWALKEAGTNFMDVTETWLDMQPNPAFTSASSSWKDVSTTTACTLYLYNRLQSSGRRG